jgi:hypothetical protein
MEHEMFLYHYYDIRSGPFKSLTAVSPAKANEVIRKIKAERPDSLCAQRDDNYVELRQNCERKLREAFAAKGGIMEIPSPHYMVLGSSPWLSTWYEKPAFIKIAVEEFDLRTVSFTYGDSMPTFSDRVNDGKEYRKKVYMYDEILKLIEKYGMPQDWNDDGRFGPERYIEAHVWSDSVIRKYLTE